MTDAQHAPEPFLVFSLRNEAVCTQCKQFLPPGTWIQLRGKDRTDGGPWCMTCAQLDHLVRLPPGDAKLTRRSKRYSSQVGVVLRWSKTRKRYERTGWLLEEAAIERASRELKAEGHQPGWVAEGDGWVRVGNAQTVTPGRKANLR